MLKQHWAEITDKIEPVPGAVILYLECPELASSAAPGQIVMLRLSTSSDPYLRQAVPIHRLMSTSLALYLAPTTVLYGQRLHVGDRLDLLGPAGRPAALDRVKSIALVAQGTGIAPLLSIADRANGQVSLLARYASLGQVYPRELVPKHVEYLPFVGASAEDAWQKALTLRQAQVTFAGSGQYLVRQLVNSYEHAIIPLRTGQVYIWQEQQMVCGSGACRGCLVTTRHKRKLCCQDGPFFDLAEF